MLARLHENLVHERRVRVLCDHLLRWLPDEGGRVLDVGAGDGRLAARLASRRPSLAIECLDIGRRPHLHRPVQNFDGTKIPFPDDSFDTVVLIDVLHHALDPLALLREVRRVSAARILIKDHALLGPFAGVTLRLMDWIGNARHGVPLPFNYWPPEVWREVFERLGLGLVSLESDLGLYPVPFRWIFDRRLHFLAVLDASSGEA